jgi:DNA primase
MQKLTLAQAKQIDLVDYLASLGYYPDPQKRHGPDYWYLSPLPGRDEKTASFKVDRRQNLWYDHGIGKGGSIIDFGMAYHGCTIPQLLEQLTAFLSFHRLAIPTGQQPAAGKREPGRDHTANLSGEEKKIRVIADGPIISPALIHYLRQRRIPVELAQAYCREVKYELYDRQYYAIGFKSDVGGYELRNPYFKGSSAPKGPRFFDNEAQQLYVFEGYFSFLSFLTLHQYKPQPPGNYLVLNSLSFFEKSRPLMDRHKAITLYLDRDKSGMKFTAQAVKNNSQYQDGSILYRNQKDLNQWLVQNLARLQQEARTFHRSEELTRETKPDHRNRRPEGKSRGI